MTDPIDLADWAEANFDRLCPMWDEGREKLRTMIAIIRDRGFPRDLTIDEFGIVRARDVPQ